MQGVRRLLVTRLPTSRHCPHPKAALDNNKTLPPPALLLPLRPPAAHDSPSSRAVHYVPPVAASEVGGHLPLREPATTRGTGRAGKNATWRKR